MADILADEVVGLRGRDRGHAPRQDVAVSGQAPVSSDDPGDVGRDLVEFLHDLIDAEAGIGFIYATLDRLAEEYRLADAVLVLDDDELGTQAFRLGRQPWDSELPAEVLRYGPGLHSVPEVVPPLVRETVTSLCQLALTLDLARHGSHHDPVTGLGNARAFREALEAAAARSARYSWPFTVVLLNFRPRGEAAGGPAITYLTPPAGFTHAIAQALRTGDIGARLDDQTFAVMLQDAGAGAVRSFVARLTQFLPVPRSSVEILVGAAAAPDESVDPAELRYLAATRLEGQFQDHGTRQSDR